VPSGLTLHRSGAPGRSEVKYFASPIVSPPGANTGNGRPRLSDLLKWQMTNPDGSYANSLATILSTNYQAVAWGSFQSDSSTPTTTARPGSAGLRYDSTANQFI
jgi:hypothetical protein